MKFTCHSEYGKLHSVYIKSVEAGFVGRQKLDKEWEALHYTSMPDFEKAKEEYAIFRKILEQSTREIHYFTQDGSVTIDAIYCRDASIATDYGMILCRMGKTDRMPEPAAQRAVLEKNGQKILGAIVSPGTLEGGDVAWINDRTLAVGLTYRTNEEGIRQLRQFLSPFGVTVISVDLPHYRGAEDVFHLMSIFSPIDKDLAVVYSPLMPIRFRNCLLDMGFDLVEVADTDFDSMGCNVLALAPRKCLMVSGNPMTEAALRKVGCEVITYKGEEISLKGGGGPTCLTRPIQRLL
ncbi:hypothetical protein FK220_004300 [Flavobacteriaceae bacterium TP-CH-4]|uniref:arginine deiminase n=1 Tax=Pelagihabitans pacificus TaxID=2696054 RepID=A0A967E5F9_9FLAO|nr:arginine deiminase family protein [Pelagihabitans pacificus]NHF58545.1 hypothetical protein [Pelagihabitans pacificus]